MSNEESHDIVNIDKIEPVAVHIEEEQAGAGKADPQKTYTVTYRLPIPVSRTWQYMFQRPGPRSGVVHQVDFSFSEDNQHVSTKLKSEPPPELILVLKKYVERANERWLRHKEAAAKGGTQPDIRTESERLLDKLKEES